ncbi:MAG: lysine--tRNA ligase [Alphaproteobacteria bacterium]|nr:lysine--tRNA ligase [Alphaproteobacteria bacterium]
MYEFDDRRLEKLQLLRDSGIAPYPHGLSVQHSAAQVLELIGERDNDALAADETLVTLAGRLLFKREMGKAGFGQIQDPTGRLQIFVRKNDLGDDGFAVWRKLDMGDHVHIVGRLMRTRTGEASVHVQQLSLAAKCIASMPDKHKGIEDAEFRNRHRYVDLFMNPDSRETFARRSEVIRRTRRFFEDRGFMEVETPMLQVIPGGATARPFVTHHNALDIDMYLRIAPELYLKRLVVGGFERVFEVNRNFRNEGVSTKHNPEFTMLEFYQAYATWHDLMDLTEELVSELAQAVCGTTVVPFGDHQLDFSRPWRRASMAELISEATGLSADDVTDPAALRARWLVDHPRDADRDLPSTMGRWFEWYFDAYVEDRLIQPTFVTGFPAEISPLARRTDGDPDFTDRFELIIAGNEIANGFNELNDPVDQAARFAAQVDARAAGDDEAMYFDADYIHALSFGMPPTAGEGIGIDRLVMLLTNHTSIRDIILFPALRPDRSAGDGKPDAAAPPPGPDDSQGSGT